MSRTPSPSDFESTAVPPYFLGKHELTQAQWIRVMGLNPSVIQQAMVDVRVDDRHPVENVSWTNCVKFCRRIGVRLPTQDEWELAARSTLGAEFGDCEELECLESRENLADRTYVKALGRPVLGSMSWADNFVHHAPVGSLRPNGFGLHDMLGNVAEWCSDLYFRSRTSSEASTSRAAEAEQRRVYRGGSWQDGKREASCRLFRPYIAEGTTPTIGLRIARSVDR